MRVHVYSEETGEGYEVVKKTSEQGEVFFGLRIWLRTPQALLDHSTAEDDDRNAVTFWAKTVVELQGYLDQMQAALDNHA